MNNDDGRYVPGLSDGPEPGAWADLRESMKGCRMQCGACGCVHRKSQPCDPLERYVHAFEPGEPIYVDELERLGLDMTRVLSSLRRRGLSPEGTDGGGWAVVRTCAA